MMTTPWPTFREPLSRTLLRTISLALAGGAVLSRWMGGWTRLPLTTVLVLWFTFGGHWVELWFLNWLRPRISVDRATQVVARLSTWFVGGAGLYLGMVATALLLSGVSPTPWSAWWLGGLAFVGVELVIHALVQLRKQPSFYNGRG